MLEEEGFGGVERVGGVRRDASMRDYRGPVNDKSRLARQACRAHVHVVPAIDES